MPQPNIEVFLNGLLVIFTDPQDERCRVGVLRNVPDGHSLKIEIQQPNSDGNFETVQTIDEASAEDQLELIVSNTSSQGISRRKMDANIDRKNGPNGDEDSFRWVVDFEGDEMYRKPIGARREGFSSIFTVNNGELLTRSLSQNELIIKRSAEDPGTLFGRVATITGIDITLDQPDSRAVFKNGDQTVFEADSKSRYRVRINRGCSGNAGNDADSYYSAVGDKLSRDGDKILFAATPLPSGMFPPNDPDARCLNMSMSRSRP